MHPLLLNLIFFVWLNIVLVISFLSKVMVYLSPGEEISADKKFRAIIGLMLLNITSLGVLVYIYSLPQVLNPIFWEFVLMGFFLLYASLISVFLNKFSHNLTGKNVKTLLNFGNLMYYFPFFPLSIAISVILKSSKSKIVSRDYPIYLTENQLKNIIEKDSELEEEEKDMLTSIIGFSNIKASEIMIPRTALEAVEHDTTMPQVLKIFKNKGFSRLPVYRENPDNIVGILYIKDLIGLTAEKFNLEELMRKPIFMPETVKLDELLKLMIEKKMQMMIILDEWGGTAGMVAMEDIIEEIIGEIEDEYDKHHKDIEKIEKNTYKIKASVEIEVIEEKLNIELPKEDVETVGGFVLTLLERIPKKGETFEYKNLHFRILDSDDRKINWLLINVRQKVKNEKTE
ncbi:CBS domain-containing protein [bacterium]|nr:CBS domain-containing protein [bacterium]